MKMMPLKKPQTWRSIPFCQNHNPKDFQDDKHPETGNKNVKTSERLKCNTPDWPMGEAAANFPLLARHDCPAKHM
jgi:hypothetical protein